MLSLDRRRVLGLSRKRTLNIATASLITDHIIRMQSSKSSQFSTRNQLLPMSQCCCILALLPPASFLLYPLPVKLLHDKGAFGAYLKMKRQASVEDGLTTSSGMRMLFVAGHWLHTRKTQMRGTMVSSGIHCELKRRFSAALWNPCDLSFVCGSRQQEGRHISEAHRIMYRRRSVTLSLNSLSCILLCGYSKAVLSETWYSSESYPRSK